jgi:hypothetical protein
MPTLDLLQWLALACVVAGAAIVAWGLMRGQLRVRDQRGAAVLAALVVLFLAVARDTLMGTDSDLVTVVAMGTVFVWGQHLRVPGGGSRVSTR